MKKIMVFLGLVAGLYAYNGHAMDKLLFPRNLINTMNEWIKGLTSSEEEALRNQYVGRSVNQAAQVRTGNSLPAGEQRYLQQRLPKVRSALAKNFGINVASDARTPHIAFVGSGGGNRAMFSTLGFLLGAQDIGLLDATVYMVGLSGSTWAIAPYAYYALTQSRTLQETQNILQYWATQPGSISGKINDAPANLTQTLNCAQTSAQTRVSWGQQKSAVDVWGARVGNSFLANTQNAISCSLPGGLQSGKLGARFSDIAGPLQNQATVPFPILTVVAPTGVGWNTGLEVGVGMLGLAAILGGGLALIKLGKALVSGVRAGISKIKEAATIDEVAQNALKEGKITQAEYDEIMNLSRLKRAGKLQSTLEEKMNALESDLTTGEDPSAAIMSLEEFVVQAQQIQNGLERVLTDGGMSQAESAAAVQNAEIGEVGGSVIVRVNDQQAGQILEDHGGLAGEISADALVPGAALDALVPATFERSYLGTVEIQNGAGTQASVEAALNAPIQQLQVSEVVEPSTGIPGEPSAPEMPTLEEFSGELPAPGIVEERGAVSLPEQQSVVGEPQPGEPGYPSAPELPAVEPSTVQPVSYDQPVQQIGELSTIQPEQQWTESDIGTLYGEPVA